MSEVKPLRVIDPVPFIGGAPDPKPEDVIYVTYPDTFDGWLAAWVVRKAAHKYQLHVEMEFDDQLSGHLEGRCWVSIGGFGRHLRAVSGARQLLLIGDGSGPYGPPLDFALWERKLPFGVVSMGPEEVVATTNPELSSLASMTYEFFYRHRAGFEPTPRLLQLNEDAVSGRGNIQFSRQIVECAKSYPFDFQMLDRLVEATEDKKRRENMIIAGQAICRYIDKNSLS